MDRTELIIERIGCGLGRAIGSGGQETASDPVEEKEEVYIGSRSLLWRAPR